MDLFLYTAVFLPAIALVSSLPRDLDAIAKAMREANVPIEDANNVVEEGNKMEEKLDRQAKWDETEAKEVEKTQLRLLSRLFL